MKTSREKKRRKKKHENFLFWQKSTGRAKAYRDALNFFFLIHFVVQIIDFLTVKREVVARMVKRTKTQTSQIVLIELDQT